MIKRVLTSKLFYLILLFVLNISILIYICILSIKPIDLGIQYIPSSEGEIMPTTFNRYLVQQKDFTIYDVYETEIINSDEMYSTYIVNDTIVQIGSEINKDDILGSYNGDNVYSLYNSFCLDIVVCNDGYEITTYNYDKFYVEVKMNSFKYLSREFESKEIFINYNDEYFRLKLTGYDFSLFQSSNVIKAIFSTENCNSLINSNSSCTLAIKNNEYKNQFYILASVFNNQTYQKSFYILDDNKMTMIFVECFEIVGDYALIKSSSFNLSKGLYLYLYEWFYGN